MASLKKVRDGTKAITKKAASLIEDDRSSIDLSSVMDRIKRVRKPGERPREGMSENDLFAYQCDLCLGSAPEGRILQCPYCGRWICRENCLVDKEGACYSCASVIRLHREAIENIREILRATRTGSESQGSEADEKQV